MIYLLHKEVDLINLVVMIDVDGQLCGREDRVLTTTRLVEHDTTC